MITFHRELAWGICTIEQKVLIEKWRENMNDNIEAAWSYLGPQGIFFFLKPKQSSVFVGTG